MPVGIDSYELYNGVYCLQILREMQRLKHGGKSAFHSHYVSRGELMDSKENISKAISALENVAAQIRRIEAQAREALYSRDEIETYREKLEEKTTLLMELPETVAPFLEGMPGKPGAEIRRAAKDFSRRASQAWELDSVFYMSGLLYPDDYKEGEKNDLENFTDRVRLKYLRSV